MSTPWTSSFKNGVPAQATASLDRAEDRRHTQLALGGVRGGAGTSTTGTGQMVRPLPEESGKHMAALQERTLLPDYAFSWTWLALSCRGVAGSSALDANDLCCIPLRHSPLTAAMRAHLNSRDLVTAWALATTFVGNGAPPYFLFSGRVTYPPHPSYYGRGSFSYWRVLAHLY